MRSALQGIVDLETSHISTDDRFAALQIDLVWWCVTPTYRFAVISFSFPYTVDDLKLVTQTD